MDTDGINNPYGFGEGESEWWSLMSRKLKGDQEARARLDQLQQVRSERLQKWCADHPNGSGIGGYTNQLEAWEEAEAEDKGREEERRRRAELRAAVFASGVGHREAEVALAVSEAKTAALRHASAWLEAQEDFLVLWGPPGTGKTCAAAWALVETLRRWQRDHYRLDGVVWRLSEEVARLGLFGAERDGEIDLLKGCPFLALDELGEEVQTDAWRQNFSTIVNARYSRRLPTVITTNADPKRLIDTYGARFADRLRQAGRFADLSKEPSMRRRAGGAR